MVKIAHFIPLFPFLAFIVNIFWGRRLKNLSAYVSIAASMLSFIFALKVFQGFLSGQKSYSLGTWLTIHGVPLKFGVMLDSLSVMMLLVVTIIATLIKIYSLGYMHGDSRFSRYFAYMSLFTASMLGLILADNFILLYIFWEGVGLCSYLLISFWFERASAATAGIKAFVTTRIGDTGFLLGIFLLFSITKTFYFSDLTLINGNQGLLTIASLLIFMGAAGKSAQFPLHVWLPDAMEGPTTVSALIHAATMVAAGVYLAARTFALFLLCPLSLEIVAIIGALSALMAASMALVNNDIKRVLAYSTMSQLGLMMLGLGVGGYNAATFHLMTHAFFKALLFLCAGSVIHAVHTQDIREMGGLFPKMKITGITFLAGALALSGIPPFSGFWSKDEILIAAFENHKIFFAVVVLTSFMTAIYMGKLIFVVFFGNRRSEIQAHESPCVMTVPLIVLAIFAALIGFLGSPFLHHSFQKFIAWDGVPFREEGSHQGIFIASILISLIGLGIAYLLYQRQCKILPLSIRAFFSPIHRLCVNKFFVDEIYESIFVKPFFRACQWSFQFDIAIIDRAVNTVAGLFGWLSGIFRFIQSGMVQNYLLIQMTVVVLIILVLLGGI